MFDRDALRVVSPGKWKTISEVLDREQFQPTEYSDSHIVWCVTSAHNVDTSWLWLRYKEYLNSLLQTIYVLYFSKPAAFWGPWSRKLILYKWGMPHLNNRIILCHGS